ncbi:hypothetical protein HCG49_16770 [Arenibacter sp. 6A1]|uniref:hypothetical protein n=1 Tax=Arenibacter sp. 6A1 TaxID=2720391 RepID=UPI001446C2B2|nr:hypothetical protein [Arenibacter sp. 6A1]NKI28208.1 hypothetical protein [Arenibacter sp. 6A1]
MKKLLLLKLLSLSALGLAQIPVTDAVANANLIELNAQMALGNTTLGEILAIQTTAKAEAVETTGNTYNTLREAEKMREMLEKVSSAVSNAKLVDEIWNTSKSLIELTFNIQRTVDRSSLKPETKRSFINSATDMLNKAEPLLELTNKILTPGILKANDLERLSFLMKIKQDLDQQLEDMQVYSYHTITINGLSLKEISDR